MTCYISPNVIVASCSGCENGIKHNRSEINEDTQTGTLLLDDRKVATFKLFTGILTCDRCTRKAEPKGCLIGLAAR